MKIIILLLVALLGAASFYLLSGYLSGQNWQTTVFKECQLDKQVCHLSLNSDQSIRLEISPRPIPLVKPLTVSVNLDGLPQVDFAQLEIEGVNMFMGLQIVPLKAINQDRLTGEFSLPICSTQHMEWKATLVIRQGNQQYRHVVFFSTDKS